MKSFIFPFAVAVIAQTSYAVKTSYSPYPPREPEPAPPSISGHNYVWYDAPWFECVAYSYEHDYIEYFGANECCLEAGKGCEHASVGATKEWYFLHMDEDGMKCIWIHRTKTELGVETIGAPIGESG